MTSTIHTAMDLHRQGRLREAEAHYRRVLASAPNQFDALHCLGVLMLQQGRPPEALELISKAVELRPASLEARANLIAALFMLHRFDEVVAQCDRVLAKDSSNVTMLYNRSVALVQLGRLAEALAGFDAVLRMQPNDINALFNRGGLLSRLRRYSAALADFDRLTARAPDNADAHNNRGNILAQLGRDTEALASYERALAIHPNHINALTNRGTILRKLQRYAEALASLDRALSIKPDHVDAHVSRGNVFLDLHRPQEALLHFQRALSIDSNNANALTNQAFALHALGRYRETLESGARALASDPQLANAHLIRGHALLKLGRPAEASASYERALALDPEQPFALGAALMSDLSACNWGRVADRAGAVKDAIEAERAIIPPFNLFPLQVDPALQRCCAENFVRRLLPGEVARLPPRQHRHSGRIRIAYLSGDFRRHPVGYLIAELIERHDRSRFEVYGISYGEDDGSPERARLIAGFDRFEDVRLLDDAATAALLNDLAIDIAIDLAGHTENSRPGILRHRPAPVQVNYLGYTGTMGADFIDYVIGDRIALPFDLQPYYTEKIVHLPDCFLVNDAKKEIAASTPARGQAGLPETGFVFCCFNNSYKISAEIFQVWMRLLAQVEGSVLWLSQLNEDATTALIDAARAAQIDPARIVFAAKLPALADHLARHRLADLFLDTTGYNAHTTASDALWAGLPLITCPGRSFPSRVAASMLTAVGLPELIADGIQAYELLALTLACNPDLLAGFRARLAENRLSRPLFDTDRFRRHIESAFASMWEMHLRGEPPRSFSVEPIDA